MWQSFCGCWNLPLYLASTITISLSASYALAREPLILPDFSATEMMAARGIAINTKVYRSGADFRDDASSQMGTIYLSDTQTMYRLMFHGTQCIETAGIPPHAMSSPLQLLSGAEVTGPSARTEVVDGHSCKIQDAQIITTDGKTIRFKLWQAQDLKGAPVKIEMRTDLAQLTTTYRNIVLGKPDPALFIPPKNCIPFAKTYQVAPPEK